MAVVPLKFDQEKGSNLDRYVAGAVQFGRGRRDPRTRVYTDYEYPSPQQLQQMLDSNLGGTGRSLDLVITLPVQSAPRKVCTTDVPTGIVDHVHNSLGRPTADGGMLTPMDTVVAQLTEAYVFRRSYAEKVFTESDGRVVYGDIAHRPAVDCDVLQDAKSGRITGFQQTLSNTPEPVTIEKPYGLVYVHGAARKPITGVSELKVAYECYLSQKKVEFLWFLYLENYSMPRTVVWGKNEDGARDAAQLVSMLRSNGVAGVPVSMAEKMEHLPVGTGGSGEYQNALSWLDSRAARSVLASFLELPGKATSGTGSYALSKDQSDLFLRLLTGFAKETAACITNDIVADLVWPNFGRGTPVPPFEIGPINPDDANVSLDLLKMMATAPSLRVPDAFVDDLVMEVARQLGMDLDKIRRAIEDKSAQLVNEASTAAGAETAPVAAAVDIGYQFARQATAP